MEIIRIYLNETFDTLYNMYSIETIGRILSNAGSHLIYYQKFLLKRNNKIVGFYFGKYIENDTFLVMQFYLLPRSRMHFKQAIDSIMQKHNKVITNVKGKELRLFDKHNIGIRIN